MDSADETIIELSKTKLALMLAGSCAFVAAGGWLLTHDAAVIRYGKSFRFFFNSPPYVYAVGLAAVVFFGLCGLAALRKLLDKKPGLVLNSSGVMDNASGMSAGLIPWSEVVGVDVFEVEKQKMLIIRVSDPRKYVERGGPIRRAINKANYKVGGNPIAVASSALKIDFPELLALFDRYLRKYAGENAARGDGRS